MSRIRSKDTKPELILRSLLHRSGLRYSIHRRDLPGVPDLILTKYRSVVFVHGCFWHQHQGCIEASKPKTQSDYWRKKLEANCARDIRNQALLRERGWKVIIVWECDLLKNPMGTANYIRNLLGLRENTYSGINRRSVLIEAEGKLKRRLGC